MSVTAARELAERLTEQGVTILVLTDFDKSGFGICYFLNHSSRRYKYKTTPKVIHIGLRLDDVLRLAGGDEREIASLSEEVTYDGKKDPRENLRARGATKKECNFLVRGQDKEGKWVGRRVELNALDSPVIVRFIEDKFREHGVKKAVPSKEVLEDAVRRAYVLHQLEQAIEGFREEADDLDIPKNLARRVRDRIAGTDDPWDQAVREIAAEQADEEDGGATGHCPGKEE
jgi:hypothetical protein